MLRSMTGFGAASACVDGVDYAAEIRSVNNRYFKPSLRLPEGFAALEADVERRLRQRIARGSVSVTLRMKMPDEWAAYRVNTAALQNYLEQLKPLEVEADPSLRIDLGTLLQLPGVCEPPELEQLAERTRDGVLELIDGALEALLAMRAAEGTALRDDLLGQCDRIIELLEAIRTRAPNVVAEYHQRLQSRVSELTASVGVAVDAESLAREVAVFADRCDIAEELSRLSGHVEQFREATDSDEPCGRKCEFIAQEMLREANTIASKSNDAEIAKAVVDIKTAIDRLKEQTQNVE
ncbi:MAG: YicC family protein [Phycisphaerae bacterium]|nr:YicC family protein [Phycisphaerae bacterium]